MSTAVLTKKGFILRNWSKRKLDYVKKSVDLSFGFMKLWGKPLEIEKDVTLGDLVRVTAREAEKEENIMKPQCTGTISCGCPDCRSRKRP